MYVTPNACGGAFYKDYIVVQMIKRMGYQVVVHYHNKGVSTRQNRFLDNFLYQRFFKGIKVILLSECLYDDVKKYVKEKMYLFVLTEYQKNENNKMNVLFLSNMIAERVFGLLWKLQRFCTRRNCL